jgi:hypothetical protein
MANVVLDLSLPADEQGFVIQGDVLFDEAGGSVSGTGDINGDGIDDLIVGAANGDNGGFDAGQAYVIFGKASATRGTIDLSSLGDDGFIIQGDAADDNAGFSTSNAGDVNGDGIDDLIVGSRRGDDGGDNAGEAYVIFGKPGATRNAIDLSSLGDEGFIIQGDRAGDSAGRSVSAAGDVNADGIDDLIVGASGGDDGGVNAGEAYVIFGKLGATRGNIDLSTFGNDGFIIQGDAAGERTGFSVSSAGDVNSDGIDDLIVGAPSSDADGFNTGKAYVIFGKEGATRGTIDLSSLGSDGFTIQGSAVGDRAGFSVSSAGDVNSDGSDDLVVGAHRGPGSSVVAGEAYVIFGKAGTTRDDINLSSLGDSGFIILGDADEDFAGFSVSDAGDINGDDIDDLVVGARFGDDGGTNAGEAYVIFGKVGATRANIELSSLGVDGIIIQGNAAGDNAGVSVSAAGDINGDGIDDLIIGAHRGDRGGQDAGEAYVIFGSVGLGSAPVVASERSYSTLVGTAIKFAVYAVDPNGDPLSFGADAPPNGALSGGGNGVFTYIPDPGFTGLDSFTVTVSDGNGGSATQSVEVSVATLPASDEWRLIAGDGYVGEMGGSGTVIGTSAYQNIGVIDQPGAITFDPSFNRGGDIIRLAGDAGDWRVVRSGSSAKFLDGDTFVTVPVGTSGLLMAFDDGDRLLRFESATQSFRIGEQDFATTLVPITAPAQDIDYPIEEAPHSVARLFLAEEATVAAGAEAGGTLDIFGTPATEHVEVLPGNVRLDPSFNRGGDLLVLDQPASDFIAVQFGSSIQLDSASTDLLIPLGTSGITITFTSGDDRTLVFDALTNMALIDDQPIGFTVVPLSEVA